MTTTFIKAQAASLIASAIDYITMLLLVELAGIWDVAASIIGLIVGGISNFIIGRIWVFKANEQKIPGQAFKYFLVWIGSLLLNAFGFYLMRHYAASIDYRLSKILVSITIGFSYNYFLQKKFVYR